MDKKEKIKACAAAMAVSSVAVAVPMLWVGMKTVHYTVRTDKMHGRVRVAAVSDLHSGHYGKGNSHLIEAIRNGSPDLVIYPGDTIDNRVCPHRTFEFVSRLAEMYPCYYVTGNHEFYRDKGDIIKKHIAKLGVTVLCGDSVEFKKGSAEFDICGLDDKYIGDDEWNRQKNKLKVDSERFTLLLSHRPDLMETYVELGVDLVVCGHAHGGHLIIPGVLNGLYAPYQGFFPKYAGGSYHEGDTTMIVSRGLMRESWPRIMNPPELVFIDIIGEE